MAAPTGGSTWETCPRATRAAWAPRRRAPCAEASQPAWRAAAPAAEAGLILRALVGARPAEPCLRLLKEREGKFKTHNEKTEAEVSSDTYPLRGKANRACGETPWARSPQALQKVAPQPASTPLPPWTPEVSRVRPAQTSSRRPRDQPPVRPARALALGGYVARPDPPESPQLSRPRGQVPPRPTSAPRTGTLMSRPQTLAVPAHLEAGLATPGPASGPG
jgi:hypothetical protein